MKSIGIFLLVSIYAYRTHLDFYRETLIKLLKFRKSYNKILGVFYKFPDLIFFQIWIDI